METHQNDIDSNSEENIQSVHDHFFRESMQYIEIGYGIARIALPLSILNRINWDVLEIAKDDWIDKRLKEYRSDILYHAKLMENNQIVNLLFEHKSKADKKTHKKLLRYILESWDLQEQQQISTELLPVVISTIVYHGDSPWKIANSIKPLIAITKETENYVPDFRVCLLDLSVFDPEQIEDSRLKIFLLTLKNSRKPDILRILPQIIRMSEKIQDRSQDDDYLKVVLVYLGSVISASLKDRFWRIIAEEHSGGEVYMETIADALNKDERLKREKLEKENSVLRKKIAHNEVEIEHKNKEIAQKTAEISNKEEEIVHKDEEIAKEKIALEQKDSEIKNKGRTLTEIVRNMLKKDMSVQSIMEIIGLSKERIEQIKKDT